MRTAKEILEEKLKDKRNFYLDAKYTVLERDLFGAMEEYASQFKSEVGVQPEVTPKIAEKAQLATDWLNSEEGQQKLRNSLDAAELFCKELREKSKVTPEDMRQIIDI